MKCKIDTECVNFNGLAVHSTTILHTAIQSPPHSNSSVNCPFQDSVLTDFLLSFFKISFVVLLFQRDSPISPRGAATPIQRDYPISPRGAAALISKGYPISPKGAAAPILKGYPISPKRAAAPISKGYSIPARGAASRSLSKLRGWPGLWGHVSRSPSQFPG